MVNKDMTNQSLLDTINKDYENNITTSTGDKITYETKSDDIDEIDWRDYLIDYPYIGIGEKPKTKKYATDEELERIIAG